MVRVQAALVEADGRGLGGPGVQLEDAGNQLQARVGGYVLDGGDAGLEGLRDMEGRAGSERSE